MDLLWGFAIRDGGLFLHNLSHSLTIRWSTPLNNLLHPIHKSHRKFLLQLLLHLHYLFWCQLTQKLLILFVNLIELLIIHQSLLLHRLQQCLPLIGFALLLNLHGSRQRLQRYLGNLWKPIDNLDVLLFDPLFKE